MMASGFSDRIMGMLESTCAVLGLSMGAELGLFKGMAQITQPFTSDELARVAGCKERYVREWLGVMACSDIVAFDAGTGKFSVEDEKLSCLTGTLPTAMSVMPILGQRHPILRECFKLNGPEGMDQNFTPDFGKWLYGLRGDTFKPALEDMILGQVPGMKEKLESGIRVADVGGGAGLMAQMIAERFPNSKVWAFDTDRELLKVGQESAKKKKLENLHFEYADVHKLSEKWAAGFDYILTYDVIHDLPYPVVALEQIYRCVKDGGVFSMFEPNVHSSLGDNLRQPHGLETYTFSLYICLPHSLSVPWGHGWGRTMGEERGREFVKQAGFEDFTVVHGDMNHFICNK